MIVERFLQWVRTAPVARRSEAAHALARSYLYSPLAGEERDGIEAAMTVLLDDPAAQVRHALADALAGSDKAPHHIIITLAGDQTQIAAIVAERSPVLLDAELVDLVATREPTIQAAVARRPVVSRAVAAAISEVAGLPACLALLNNPGAQLARFSLDRVIERHGDDAELRELLLARPDLPLDVRQALVSRYVSTLRALVAANNWMSAERVDAVIQEASDRAVIAMAFEAPAAEMPALVRRLIETDELTPALLIRAVVSGQRLFFEESLAALSGVPVSRVSALVASGRAANLKALLEKARLPRSTFAVFAAAIDVIRRYDDSAETGNAYRRATHLIDAIVSRYATVQNAEVDEILALLRRFATEAKRDAARGYIARVMRAA